MSYKLLRLPDVIKQTGLSRSSIYAKVKTGEFPAPIKISERVSAWNSQAINDFIEAKIAESKIASQGGE